MPRLGGAFLLMEFAMSTKISTDNTAPPDARLPHERDESDDQQHGAVRNAIKRAHDDVRAGRVDTGYRNAIEHAENAVVKGKP